MCLPANLRISRAREVAGRCDPANDEAAVEQQGGLRGDACESRGGNAHGGGKCIGEIRSDSLRGGGSDWLNKHSTDVGYRVVAVAAPTQPIALSHSDTHARRRNSATRLFVSKIPRRA